MSGGAQSTWNQCQLPKAPDSSRRCGFPSRIAGLLHWYQSPATGHLTSVSSRYLAETKLFLSANITPDICGFFFREAPDYTPPQDLASWLKDGPTPIYVGFGSIVLDDPEQLTQTIVNAVREAGVRAIISKGWSNLGGGSVGPDTKGDIFYLGDCPHEWLFQNVSAVVHHGGAGTTACGLLNGRPTSIIPFFGE